MKVQIPYSPRPQQAYLHQQLDKYRYGLLLCHRRFGKTTLCLNHLLRCALTNKNYNPRYAYVAPTYKQAKSIAWDFLKFYAEKIPGTKFNETELRADFINGSRITLLSSENPDSIRGVYLDGVIVDEVAQIQASLIDEVITPALSDRKGFMIMVGTPAGMNNIFYDYYLKAQEDKNWLLYKAKASETKIVDQEELDNALSVMGKAKFDQEFECSFVGNVPGSIYGEIISDLEDKRRISNVPYDPSYLVHTAFDIGFKDDTTIIFFQDIGHTINIIDCYSNRNQALPHYIQVMKEKPYIYGTHYAPHDIEVTEFTSGRSRRETAFQLGVKFKVVPKTPLEDGIHAVKMLLPRCQIDIDNCKPLLNALRHYHRRYNERERIYASKPVHSWSSHFADAMRVLATGFHDTKFNPVNRQQVADNKYNIL
jgi:phage terminase large subunit